jgi:ActR/RegA family two-component response regulator
MLCEVSNKMTPDMDVRALLLSTDHITASMIRRSLNSVGVTPEEGVAIDDALGRVRRQKFEAIVVDLTMDGSRDLMSALRAEKCTKSSVVFALAEGKTTMREAFQLGATFVLEKPLNLERSLRCFRAAYGLIVGERRRYYRHKINVPVTVMRSGGETVTASCVDLSTGGMLMEISTPVSECTQLKVQFGLPRAEERIAVAAEAIWCKSGKVGVRFTRFGNNSKEVLSIWLSEKMELELNGHRSSDNRYPAFN